jgi:SnoaL-like domain
MAEAKEKWDEVGERFGQLGRELKGRFDANSAFGATEKETVTDALRQLSDALDAGFTTIGDTFRDPAMRDDLKTVEEIKALKARYFRCMDTKDWDGFADQFTSDAALDVSGEMRASANDDGLLRGRSEITAFVRGAIDPVTTVHHGHMPEIEIVSPTQATGVWAMEDMLRWPEGSPIRAMHGYGHYHETYEKSDGRWRIASLKLTRLQVDVEMPD